ncbi:uncharacterized protein TNCV_4002761 [Trichonephila clavipes]|nr:uncharacterized protein TNCV_4002761 [Trichonephila clavipes]
MASRTIALAVGVVYRSISKAGLRRSPRCLHTLSRLSSLPRLNLDSSLKMTWFHSTAVQFPRAWHHSKWSRRWVVIKGSTHNWSRDPKCPSARYHRMIREDTEAPSKGTTFAWMATDQAFGLRVNFLPRGGLLDDWFVDVVQTLVFVYVTSLGSTDPNNPHNTIRAS